MPALITSSSIPAIRLASGFAGVVALVAATLLLGPWALALWLIPDVALLFGLSRGFADSGRLAPRAVAFYNALHAYPGPVVLAASALVLGTTALALAILWFSHIAIDWALGYGLRTPEGLQRG